MQGKPLTGVLDSDEKIRDYAIYGYHGSQIGISDGRYTYFHSAAHLEAPAELYYRIGFERA